MSENLAIISDLKNFISLSQSDHELKKLFTSSISDFTPKRKLDFEQVVLMLLNFSYAIEIASFLTLMGTEESTVSKCAFSQQRIKINSFFFNGLDAFLIDNFTINTL